MRVGFPVLAESSGVHILWLENYPATRCSLPISSRLVDLVNDPETVEAIYLALEATLKSTGGPLDGLQVSLDQPSCHILESNRWQLQGDSLGLAVYLQLSAVAYPELFQVPSVIATGALRKKCSGVLTVGSVAFIKEKMAGIFCSMTGYPKFGVILPMEQVKEVAGLAIPQNCQLWGMTPSLRLQSLTITSGDQEC